mmetsp:Transcript_112461/g.195102  ORF Transcript_112461/g.195102 Transcript_112461/m.195102 type:complete len:246 (-) Transcript_112461:376-1113(-)
MEYGLQRIPAHGLCISMCLLHADASARVWEGPQDFEDREKVEAGDQTLHALGRVPWNLCNHGDTGSQRACKVPCHCLVCWCSSDVHDLRSWRHLRRPVQSCSDASGCWLIPLRAWHHFTSQGRNVFGCSICCWNHGLLDLRQHLRMGVIFIGALRGELQLGHASSCGDLLYVCALLRGSVCCHNFGAQGSVLRACHRHLPGHRWLCCQHGLRRHDEPCCNLRSRDNWHSLLELHQFPFGHWLHRP